MNTITNSPLVHAVALTIGELLIASKHFWGCVIARARYSGGKGLRLHLGCGRDYRVGWVNIDLRRRTNVKIDLRRPLPFAASCAAYVYAEHLLEHLAYPDVALQLLQECERVLAPGGQLRLGVPDTEWVLQAYVDGPQNAYFRLAKEHWHPSRCQTRMEHVNHHFRDDGDHLFAYDFETLESLMRRAGFSKVTLSAFDPATDSVYRAVGTLYVDAWTAR